MSTIAAVSTPAGAGGIGIIRVSGEDALKIADTIFVCRGEKSTKEKLLNSPMTMVFGRFLGEELSDVGYAVYFQREKAYTGEDTVELYLHGGVRIMQGALAECLKNGARLAERGEFTKRAFLAGRMSLADAEGVADMINAESAAAVRAAYRLMDGTVSRMITEIEDKLLSVITGLEATLDYPDEMEDEVLPPLEDNVKDVLRDVDRLLSTARQGKMAKHGITAVLAGAPNAGKSSLFNALIGKDHAIVTPVAGTTRDAVEAHFECDGVMINLVDTAGLRESDDIIESEGIKKAHEAIRSADVILLVLDTTKEWDEEYDFGEVPVFLVRNKCDLTSYKCPLMAGCYAISAKDGTGVDLLRHGIASLYRFGKTQGGEIITSERHLSALYHAKTSLESALCNITETVDCVLVDLREAFNTLGEITGRTASEAVVDSVFAKFCVGK